MSKYYTKPRLTVKQVLRWADAHHKRTGRWPNTVSGRVKESPMNTWRAIYNALRTKLRGLPHYRGGIAQLFAKHRGVRKRLHRPPLSIGQILKWVDAYHKRTGRWPNAHSGRIALVPGITWYSIDRALRMGFRGLAGGDSLCRLLERRRRVSPYTRRR